MPAGDEMNELVAVHVCGLRRQNVDDTVVYYDGREPAYSVGGSFVHDGGYLPALPNFSEDIAAAWKIVDWMTNTIGPHDAPYAAHVSFRRGEYVCQFCPGCVCHTHDMTADTAPLEICRAVLMCRLAPGAVYKKSAADAGITSDKMLTIGKMFKPDGHTE